MPPSNRARLSHSIASSIDLTFHSQKHGYQWTIATRKEDLTPEEIKVRMDDFFEKFAPAQA